MSWRIDIITSSQTLLKSVMSLCKFFTAKLSQSHYCSAYIPPTQTRLFPYILIWCFASP